MDFFGAQRDAHRCTKRLVLLFACAVACLIVGLHALISGLWVLNSKTGVWFDPEVFTLVAFGTLLIVGLGCLYKIRQLRGGGAAVCRMLGARPVLLIPVEPELKQLRNIVEEMAIAAGLPVPDLYLMAEETGLNAFAAGFTPCDAAICVTRGMVEQLNRDELQGVIAHEFSHVLNGDMRLNIRLLGVLHGILCISMAGHMLLKSGHYGGGRRGAGLGLMGLGLGLLCLGSVGAFFASLIKAAVSRQREYLADASAVQFTRNPGGISGALKKIAGFVSHGSVRNSQARATSHMFFTSALNGGMSSLLATHPPILERIAAIDPLFAKYAEDSRSQQKNELVESAVAGTEGIAGLAGPIDARQSVETIGEIDPEHLAYGRQVLDQLPVNVASALHDPFSARAVIYCLLLDTDSGVRRGQFKTLHQQADEATTGEAMHLSEAVRELPRELRLPLIDLAMPALRLMSLAQARVFRRVVRALIDADDRVTLFEFTLEKILNRQLDSAFLGPQTETIRFTRTAELHTECAMVLSMLAFVGHDDRDAAQQAYADGSQSLGSDRPMLALADCSRHLLGAALDKLLLASAEVKQQTLSAFALAVASDGRMTASESEMLRCVSEAMNCPMPPVPLAREAVAAS